MCVWGGLSCHNSPRRERAAGKEKPVGAVRDLKTAGPHTHSRKALDLEKARGPLLQYSQP